MAINTFYAFSHSCNEWHPIRKPEKRHGKDWFSFLSFFGCLTRFSPKKEKSLKVQTRGLKRKGKRNDVR